MSAAPRRRSSPPPLGRLYCPLASMQRPWWDLDPTIALFAERATASFHRARRTAPPTILLAREYHPQNIRIHNLCVCAHAVLTVDFSLFSLPSGPDEQDGPSQIKILITNHCPDCSMLNVDGQVQGHFDINNAPGGWNNPRIFYKQLDNSECM